MLDFIASFAVGRLGGLPVTAAIRKTLPSCAAPSQIEWQAEPKIKSGYDKGGRSVMNRSAREAAAHYRRLAVGAS
jgi:hypothetical protein